MAWGTREIRITDGTTTWGAIHTTPEVKAALSAMGFDPAAYNVVRWPIGASRHGRAVLLITETVAKQLLGAEDDRAKDPLSLRIGDGTNYITITNLHAHHIEPLLVGDHGLRTLPEGLDDATTGSRLYALTLVDDRYYWTRRLTGDYNVLGDDRTRITPTTLNVSDNPWSYDAIINDINTQVGSDPNCLPTFAGTLEASEAFTAIPLDVMADGRLWPEVVDSLLAETGRVWVHKIDGTNVVEPIDQRSVSGWLQSLQGKVIAGSARAVAGTPLPETTGTFENKWLSRTIPQAEWAAHAIPEYCSVWAAAFGPKKHAYRRRFPLDPLLPGYGAADVPLPFRTGYRVRLVDNFPIIMGPTGTRLNDAEAAIRGTRIGQRYYRRWRAGECDVLLMGTHNITPGGSAQEIVWSLDGESGFTTRVMARADCPLYMREAIDIGIDAAFGDAFVVESVSGEQKIVIQRDVMQAKISEATGSAVDFPDNITYEVVDENGDDLGPFAVGLVPEYRTVIGMDAQIQRASAGSPCTIAWEEYTTTPELGRKIRLLAVKEPLSVEECSTTAPGTRSELYDVDVIETDTNGDVISDTNGDILTNAEAATIDALFADSAFTDVDGNPISDVDGNVELTTEAPSDHVELWDQVETDADGNVLSDVDGNVLLNAG